MDEELQELRDLVVQLRADNARLQQAQAPVGLPVPDAALPSTSAVPPVTPPPSGVTPERFVFVPRDRRCPKFNGKSGLTIDEWVEEAQACMRLRYMSVADKAFFLIDHLEGEAREEIRYRSDLERGDPNRIIQALRDVYGCSQSYVALQEAFFSRKQLEGETLLEFSLALMGLLERVKNRAPHVFPNAEILLRDQFVEHVTDSALRRELKQMVRRQPTATLLEVRSEAIRWEQEGMPGGARGRSQSVPLTYGIQYGVRSETPLGVVRSSQQSELGELREMLRQQQQQLNQLTQTFARFQTSHAQSNSSRSGPIVCRRCQQPGHFARDCRGQRSFPRPPQAASGFVTAENRRQRSPQPSGN